MTTYERASLALIGRVMFDYRQLPAKTYCTVKHLKPVVESDIIFAIGDAGMSFEKSGVVIEARDKSFQHKLWTPSSNFGRDYFRFRHEERHASRDMIIDSVSSREIKGEVIDGKFIIKDDGNPFIKVVDEAAGTTFSYQVYY